MRKLLLSFCLLCLFGLITSFVFLNKAEAQADPGKMQELARQIAEYETQIKSLQAKASTLANQISQFNAQIKVTELKIEQTEEQIALLSGRIGTLNDSVSSLSKAYDARVIERYKLSRIGGDAAVIANSANLRDALTRYEYLARLQKADQTLLSRLKKANDGYQTQKAEQEELNEKLATAKKDLDNQKSSKAQLLTVTNNDEKRYQSLLSAAKAELASLSSFARSRGVTVLPPQNSPDGWYFSQRDERWAMMCIGNSCGTGNQENILDVGCLVSSTAMVKKKFGEDVTPLSIARNTGYFYSTTAYMNQPWPAPSGYRYERSSYSQDKLDAELREGRPVIVHLRINTRDGHFVVIKSGSGGNYTMHDPIEGYDKKFSDFYSTGQIGNINILKKT